MVLENNNQKEQQDIVKQENGNENKGNTIERVLQEKFQDPTKESFFMDIFNDPQIKNIYAQQSLINFIQGDEKISKFYRTSKEAEHDEKVKDIMPVMKVEK